MVANAVLVGVNGARLAVVSRAEKANCRVSWLAQAAGLGVARRRESRAVGRAGGTGVIAVVLFEGADGAGDTRTCVGLIAGGADAGGVVATDRVVGAQYHPSVEVAGVEVLRRVYFGRRGVHQQRAK